MYHLHKSLHRPPKCLSGVSGQRTAMLAVAAAAAVTTATGAEERNERLQIINNITHLFVQR